MSNDKLSSSLDSSNDGTLPISNTIAAVPQPDRPARSALAAIKGVAAFYRIQNLSDSQSAHDVCLKEDFCAEDVVRIARIFGLKAKLASNQNIERLSSIFLPAIIELKDGSFGYLANRDPQSEKFFLFNPINWEKRELISNELYNIWTGKLILVTRRTFGAGSDPRTYGFRWFVPTLWRYRGPLAHVLLASLFIQLFALSTPLFFQLVFDKVLMHKGLETLTVLVIGLAIIGLFDALLQYLRSYALSHTASRIDAELGSRLFEHLMRLPVGYFETRQTGQTVARVRELETIRQFLTGQGVSSVIDTGFALVLVAVLFIYSAKLALIVLLSAPCYILVSSLVRPLLLERTKEKFNRSAQSQQFLVESVVGIQTIKAAAVEPIMRAEWDERLAAYLGTSFRAVMTGAGAQSGIQYISRLTTAIVLFFGAQEVMSGTMSIGELIAFNMIAGQITQPILRLSQLWQDFQQVRISVERIGDILNAPTEPRPPASATLPPPLKGAVRFEDASFRYSPGGRDILQGINLIIEPGQVVGVVGPSGSGKSTLTKLIQRLYIPSDGRILLDGRDITEIDPGWLRRQVGVVLQENLLFNRTVHENIAFAYPGLAREQVIRVAKLAGAHEFIMCLPKGYDTEIEERGANLSGGQRQRIAIARALATNPRILILDEATSALDYESEQIIQANMRDIVRGRTVIIVSHRLGAVRDCDRIISIGDGRIVEDGTHEELLTAAGGPYARFWGMQMRVATGGR